LSVTNLTKARKIQSPHNLPHCKRYSQFQNEIVQLLTGLLEDGADVGQLAVTTTHGLPRHSEQSQGNGPLVRNTNKFDDANLGAWYSKNK
jgi:hypothetical protein